MARRKPLPPGDYPAEILDFDQNGRGFARVDGKATFIADALPGERVRFKYLAVGKDFDEGQCVSVEQASAHRVEPGCPHFGVCGGCSMQHLHPDQQIAFKQKQLLDQLQRIGKVAPQQIAPPITAANADDVWGYRRRARLGAKRLPSKGGAVVGFRERNTHFVTPLTQCPVIDPRVGQKIMQIRALIDSLSIPDRVPQVEIACADRVAMVFRLIDPATDEDLAKLTAFGAREGVDVYLQTGGPATIRPLSADPQPLTYSPDGSDLRLRFEPTDFIQVNGFISQQTVNQALDWLELQAGDRVLELFCGLGNFSLPLAQRGAEVIAVEGEQALVDRARENAQRNGITGARFEKADLFRTEAGVDWLTPEFDKVLLDPPRAGAREILPIVAARKPQRIVYVSCHPGTLARDAGTLVHEHGYQLARAGVMDMFPHTGHVESMALFVRA
ncbi:23S rRNA (uracil(1939)-C(5))-methyltransferase RlmD [Sinimarinibacterium sp. NLF-5-8]|uniref:23S rRNA (uracil(1939)-C(5))-methyltransferase RlmD n=1 Tax=Sinimarinibacterium sp. NLF-5-8 TaxID=2698684 RepID=UPI00137C3864|nr:23S rRNA (uracil(1939)-C(5))-methyltransferase RlmD [Sinimarinibacterium sp. NLF-5-8]QHS09820.1 23S rRNA (uracil(1939)-C(5))-methyltransferase RlmD [Sinimarinibacterium sp. NLF-5-8]